MQQPEKIIDQCQDRDFGALKLVEIHTRAGAADGSMQPMALRNWCGRVAETDSAIRIEDDVHPSLLPETIRLPFRQIIADPEAFKQRVAADAVEWAEDGALDATALAALLQIACFAMAPERLTVWLTVDAERFDGHVMEVRIEDGEIAEICMAG